MARKTKYAIRWKVVRLVGKGKRGRMVSCVVSTRAPHCGVYEIGKATRALFGGCFVFRTLANALSFMCTGARNEVIIKCRCAQSVALPCFAWVASAQACRTAWAEGSSRTSWPLGTEAYRYVTPLEVVA